MRQRNGIPQGNENRAVIEAFAIVQPFLLMLPGTIKSCKCCEIGETGNPLVWRKRISRRECYQYNSRNPSICKQLHSSRCVVTAMFPTSKGGPIYARREQHPEALIRNFTRSAKRSLTDSLWIKRRSWRVNKGQHGIIPTVRPSSQPQVKIFFLLCSSNEL